MKNIKQISSKSRREKERKNLQSKGILIKKLKTEKKIEKLGVESIHKKYRCHNSKLIENIYRDKFSPSPY